MAVANVEGGLMGGVGEDVVPASPLPEEMLRGRLCVRRSIH